MLAFLRKLAGFFYSLAVLMAIIAIAGSWILIVGLGVGLITYLVSSWFPKDILYPVYLLTLGCYGGAVGTVLLSGLCDIAVCHLE